LSFTFLLTGCDEMMNTPTKQVETLLAKYQKMDESIIEEIDELATEANLTTEQQERYKNLLKRQYQNLTYRIEDEEIDGDTAIVTVEIEVTDFKKVVSENEEEYRTKTEYTMEEFNNDKLKKLENASDKVEYTLRFNVKKENDSWKVTNLTNIDLKKLQGMY